VSFDPSKPELNAHQVKAVPISEPQPSDAEIVSALVEIEHATHPPSEIDPSKNQPANVANGLVPGPVDVPKFLTAQRSKILIAYVAVILVGFGMMRLAYLSKSNITRSTRTTSTNRFVDSVAQHEIEGLLARVAAGDQASATNVMERAPSWTGRVQRSTSTTRSIDIAFNLPDLHQREAAIEAALTLGGIPKSEAGIQTLQAQLPTPAGRPWALWMLGALGHRGVDPVHTAKMIGAYIDNPDANTRAAAVNALAVLATDETIPMLLDRFRNDPSLAVEERAACGLAESGMYTHEQRMVAAATLVSWLDDSLLSPQQRTWTIQALADISHQNFGNDSAAWRNWYESARASAS